MTETNVLKCHIFCIILSKISCTTDIMLNRVHNQLDKSKFTILIIKYWMLFDSIALMTDQYPSSPATFPFSLHHFWAEQTKCIFKNKKKIVQKNSKKKDILLKEDNSHVCFIDISTPVKINCLNNTQITKIWYK